MPPSPAELSSAIDAVPPGAWAVGVSGGADSVALCLLAHTRADLRLHVVHLDHQTRGQASTDDAEFVEALAARFRLPCTVARRCGLEQGRSDLSANPSARYRALRLMLFRQVVRSNDLCGVLLAHHADDQAETIFSRLLRGAGYSGLVGMTPETAIDGLTIVRPLLRVRREQLRAYLAAAGETWREDASNRSDDYQRNRLRRVLAAQPWLFDDLLAVGEACRDASHWTRRAAPHLDEEFRVERLAALPTILARESARRWLLDRGTALEELDRASDAIDRLIGMASDAATPARQAFSGGMLVRRRRGIISGETESS